MAVKIRLSRTGKRNATKYRIIAIDESAKRNGKALAILGLIDSTIKPPKVEVDKKKLEKWIGFGAQLTDGVRKLISS